MTGKKKLIIWMGFITLLVCTAFTVWGDTDINPGKWEITTETQMAGMPSQSMTHTQCITAQDLVPATYG
jgi:hypothetical protein